VICSESELRHSVEAVAKMYGICDRIAAQTIGDPETRRDEIESTQSMIRKVEREIAEYLAEKYGLLKQPEKQKAGRAA
jgi:hypothetical protein